jgi:hypothetical protein
MGKLVMLVTLLVTLFGCSMDEQENKEQPALVNLELDGYWLMSYGLYLGETEQLGCPVLDAPIEWTYQPRALGSHLLIKDDSISIFRYPYAYYGTYKYEIIEDSLFIKSDYTSTYKFSIQKKNEDTLVLNFEEEFTSTCLLSSEASYTSFIPDSEIINKLIQDSISCDSLIGKWWYLRKEISSEDGTEPTILNFPKEMPDSIFVSQEIINQDIIKPFIELELDNRIVKLFFKNPYEYSFTLEPEIENDDILFARFIDYLESEDVDTVFHDVIYRRWD